MDKIKFYTAYDALRQPRSKMDEHDNVNRICFVDSTALVKRMINEGKNLIAYRAKAMMSGMYDFDAAIKESGNVPAMPVYETDPVICSEIIGVYKDELEAHAAVNAASSESVENTASESAASVESDNN